MLSRAWHAFSSRKARLALHRHLFGVLVVHQVYRLQLGIQRSVSNSLCTREGRTKADDLEEIVGLNLSDDKCESELHSFRRRIKGPFEI